jgi:hypothetical protein
MIAIFPFCGGGILYKGSYILDLHLDFLLNKNSKEDLQKTLAE